MFNIYILIKPLNLSVINFPEHSGSPPIFRGVRVTRSLALCVRLLYFFFWPLCCLFFFDIQILITPLVSLNSSVCVEGTYLK